MTVATKIDSVDPAQPLEITSLRGDVRVAAGAVATCASASAQSELLPRVSRSQPRCTRPDVAIGPGRILVCVLVAAWSAAAVSRRRATTERTAELDHGRRRVSGRGRRRERVGHRPARSVPTRTRAASAVLALSVALLPAVGLHLALEPSARNARASGRAAASRSRATSVPSRSPRRCTRNGRRSRSGNS